MACPDGATVSTALAEARKASTSCRRVSPGVRTQWIFPAFSQLRSVFKVTPSFLEATPPFTRTIGIDYTFFSGVHTLAVGFQIHICSLLVLFWYKIGSSYQRSNATEAITSRHATCWHPTTCTRVRKDFSRVSVVMWTIFLSAVGTIYVVIGQNWMT